MIPLIVKPNKRILIIDDNSAIHDDFRKILGAPEAIDAQLANLETGLFGGAERVWFDIDTALQGDEGLAKVAQSLAHDAPYAVAFVDVRMPPGWDGIETSKRLWQVDPHLQIVLCTAYSDYSWDRMQEHLHPGDRMLILKKPFDAIEVQQLANALTEKWRLAREAGVMLTNLDRMVRQRTAELETSRAIALDQASLLDKARDAIFVCGMDNRLCYWNRSAEALYGWTAAEAMGREMGELLRVDPLQYTPADAAVRRCGEWAGELRHMKRDGGELLVESRWTLVRDGDGRAKAVLAINTDVTEKKRMESHLLRAQRMESIGTLAGGIAHDLNNVLLPIMMSVDLLRSDIQDEQQLAVLASIERNARRGAEMVQQVLSFGRGADGQRQTVDPATVVEQISHFVHETFPKTIEFKVGLPERLPCLIGDPTQLHQVLLNLCVNARDAMSGEGSLTLEVQEIEISGDHRSIGIKPGIYVVWHVTDTGPGIPVELRDRIFDPFFTTKAATGGTGLGLATVSSIVKSHGGFLELYSAESRGTTFSVYFPASETHPVVLPSDDDSGSAAFRGSGETILFLDDEAEVRQVMRGALTRLNYGVITCSDGMEALYHAAEKRGSLAAIITDLYMPTMDGVTFVELLKRMLPDAKMIVTSGKLDDRIGDRLKALGVHALLDKPFSQFKLARLLKSVLQQS